MPDEPDHVPFGRFSAREKRLLGVAAVFAVLLGYYLQVIAFDIFRFVADSRSPDPTLSDLHIYRQGGQFLRDGLPLYSDLFVATTRFDLPWTYTPFGAVVMVPLTLPPVPVLDVAWVLASLIALAALVVICFQPLLTRVGRPRLAAAVLVAVMLPLTPVADGFMLGQIGVVLTLACVFDAVVLARRQSRWTGVLIGLATAIKLTPAVFIGYWLITRQWRAAFTAIITVLVSWTAAAVIAWSDTWAYFGSRRFLSVGDAIGIFTKSRFNQSWHGVVDRLADGRVAVWLLLVVITVVVGFWLSARAYRNGDLLAAAAIVGLVSVLCSPVSWHHHAVWLLPALAAVLGPATSRARTLVAFTLLILCYYPARGFQYPWATEQWVLLYVVVIAAVAAVSARRSGGTAFPASRAPGR